LKKNRKEKEYITFQYKAKKKEEKEIKEERQPTVKRI
jgi:hypothetical protein